MTEEIIIDGINVAGCEYLRIVGANWWCECNNGKEYGTKTRVTACGGCKYNSNCYYKQLIRLEQELNDLRQVRKDTPDIQEPYVVLYRQIKKQYHKLEQERDELKKLNEEASAIIDCKKGTIASLAKVRDELKQENEKLKKELESQKGLITVGGKAQYQYLQKIEKLEQENEELKELNTKICEDCSKEIKHYWNTFEEIKHGIMHIPPYDKQSAQMIEALLKLIDEVLDD